jgi:hypothetical protein
MKDGDKIQKNLTKDFNFKIIFFMLERWQDDDRAACLLADAFITNNAYTYIFKDIKDCGNRRESLVYFFRILFEIWVYFLWGFLRMENAWQL